MNSRKRRINPVLMSLALAVGLAGCAGSGTEEASEIPAADQVQESVESTAVVLNPNLAGEEELLVLSHLDEAMVAAILERRPFLTMTELTVLLDESLSQEQRAELYVTLFVSMNLNTTAEEDFQLVPGVGPRLAHEFEEYRPYDSIAQFRREIGKYVDEEEVARLEQYVFVPINLNTASDEEILSIPGVGEKLLHEFKEYRPYDSIEQFRREIGKYVDDQEILRLERFVTL
ncbi:MAG: helix-hairpin-helix domain-containing protein [Acidobacteria bacterium]|nr:helix-hairpin-helix domain-containing protein [Acidobacteriota bacterium]